MSLRRSRGLDTIPCKVEYFSQKIRTQNTPSLHAVVYGTFLFSIWRQIKIFAWDQLQMATIRFSNLKSSLISSYTEILPIFKRSWSREIKLPTFLFINMNWIQHIISVFIYQSVVVLEGSRSLVLGGLVVVWIIESVCSWQIVEVIASSENYSSLCTALTYLTLQLR